MCVFVIELYCSDYLFIYSMLIRSHGDHQPAERLRTSVELPLLELL